MTTITEISKTHNLYIVKHNENNTIRLAKFTDILYDEKQQNRVEIEITNLTKEEAENPNWQANCIIWWSPNSDFWYEATREDKRSEEEYQFVLRELKRFPDINPNDPNSSGTLVKRFGIGDKYTVVDGNARILHKL